MIYVVMRRCGIAALFVRKTAASLGFYRVCLSGRFRRFQDEARAVRSVCADSALLTEAA